MMKRHEIETATREQLADELAAACQSTEGWQTMPIEQLRADVLAVVSEYAKPCTIRNINDQWGMPVTFTAPTLEEALAELLGMVCICGHKFYGVLREGVHYEVVADAEPDDSIRLGDLGTAHVWFTSVGQPAGCDLIDDNGESPVPDEWADLTGTITDGKWNWDGTGSPTDVKGNTVLRIVAFDPALEDTASWAVLVRTSVDTWTTHSTHDTREAAQDQADYVGGRVVKKESGEQ